MTVPQPQTLTSRGRAPHRTRSRLSSSSNLLRYADSKKTYGSSPGKSPKKKNVWTPSQAAKKAEEVKRAKKLAGLHASVAGPCTFKPKTDFGTNKHYKKRVNSSKYGGLFQPWRTLALALCADVWSVEQVRWLPSQPTPISLLSPTVTQKRRHSTLTRQCQSSRSASHPRLRFGPASMARHP